MYVRVCVEICIHVGVVPSARFVHGKLPQNKLSSQFCGGIRCTSRELGTAPTRSSGDLQFNSARQKCRSDRNIGRELTFY